MVSGILGVGIAVLILYLIRRDHLHSRYALWWLPAALVIAVFGVYPNLTDRIAPLLGIAYPPVLVLMLGMLVLVVKILVMDIERSRNERKLHRLVQRVAMLEARIERLAKRGTEDGPG